jgi:hypothetical protein
VLYELLFVQCFSSAVYPAKAKRFVNRIAPVNGRLIGVLFVTNKPNGLTGAVVLL